MNNPLIRILLVEDDPDIQLVAQFGLEDLGGFTVALCDSGADAIRLAPHFMPDLLLLDVMMPLMDGPQTLAAVRKLPGHSQVPVIFMTAKAQRRDLEQLRALGALDVIVKPFDPLTLGATIRTIWGTQP